LLDIEKFRNTLYSILEDSDLLNQFSELDKYHNKINELQEKFGKQIQVLVNNIEIGYIIKGSCKAYS